MTDKAAENYCEATDKQSQGDPMLKFLIASLLTANFALAANKQVIELDFDRDADPHFEISRVEIVEHEEVKANYVVEKAGIKDVVMIVDSIIAIGKKIWPIIEAGKPVVDVNMGRGISVIPFKGQDQIDAVFFDMERWSAPKAKSYTVTYKNGLRAAVISFTYTVMFQYGGQYEGKGKYLAGINVVAQDVEVAWGFKFNASSELMQISNHGTKEDRVAGATFKIKYTAESFLKKIKNETSFHVMGNGQLIKY
ncbi:hypothetical protein M901_2039 [Bacteriovorax sp. DB6_IX]|nr:hypothetical protein M901_2039 [Bacteriovorax sp. DB6_IX]